jgi:hypothetical protein
VQFGAHVAILAGDLPVPVQPDKSRAGHRKSRRGTVGAGVRDKTRDRAGGAAKKARTKKGAKR